MTADLFTSTGTKSGTLKLPASLFEQPISKPLMHALLRLQQNNRRHAIAHTKLRREITGSTRKLYRQKGTGRARRGSASANILRGGAKAFGPRNTRNFTLAMPKAMRRQALRSCLSLSAKEGRVIGLEGYDSDHKTKGFAALLQKLPVDVGRKIVLVLPEKMDALEKSSRNVPGVKTIRVEYLNPEDVLGASHLIFVSSSAEAADRLFGGEDVVLKSRTNGSSKEDAANAKEQKAVEKSASSSPTPATS